jgi:hypothetical protein
MQGAGHRANRQNVDSKGPTGNPQLGDTTFFTDDLLNDLDKVVGTHSGSCALLRITPADAPDLYECQATFSLPLGQITARGLYHLPMAVGQMSHVAITGGTGAYANAAGQASWTELAAGGRIVLDVRL